MAVIVKEKVFEHYLEFPADVRMVVINEMSIEDRCRFTRCSKLSQKEAQKCKKYIYGLRFYACSPNNINFRVIYHENQKNNHFDYNVTFVPAYDGKNYIVYSNRYGVELWRSELDSSTYVRQYACENVKNMLNIYQKTIKMLSLVGTGNYDFGIQSLNNLESLELENNTDIQRIMSKIRKPLKEFVCNQPMSKSFARYFEKQIYEIQNLLRVDGISINYEQFRKLSAQKIHINIGHLTEEDIYDFIDSWQNDKIRSNFIQ